mmetsp:Transcript_13862/g.25478  ORF Transcript_13862/g.25478 Transcript_13862/m.25478 type:complete len:145 (+) Transcript_13862:59-493(+)
MGCGASARAKREPSVDKASRVMPAECAVVPGGSAGALSVSDLSEPSLECVQEIDAVVMFEMDDSQDTKESKSSSIPETDTGSNADVVTTSFEDTSHSPPRSRPHPPPAVAWGNTDVVRPPVEPRPPVYLADKVMDLELPEEVLK